MESLIKYNNQTAGRDRMFRLFQYGSRLFWWICEKSSKHYDVDKVDAITKLKSLEYTLSTGRKLLLLGRSLESFYGALKSIHLPDLTLRLTLTMAKINHALYLLMDHVLWFGRVGLLDIDKEKWGKRANKFWLFSVIMLLTRDVYDIYQLVRLESKPPKLATIGFDPLRPFLTSQNESRYSQLQDCFSESVLFPLLTWCFNHKDLTLDTIKNGCDVVIPLSGLGVFDVSPGLVGVCGVISSLVGMLTISDPTCRIQPN